MIYYKVKKQFDGKQCFKPNTGDRLIPNGWNLIANELITPYEMKARNVNERYTEKVTIKKTNTYFCFGARFEISE